MLDLWITNGVLRLVNGMVSRLLKLLVMRFENGYDDKNAHYFISSRLETSETFSMGRDDVIELLLTYYPTYHYHRLNPLASFYLLH
jgi:hypothetical protein